jgi:apolipoprotein D and lipocalin family protein
MGDWYVIANIPTFLETQSYAATESYSLAPDGSVTTVFSQRKGSLDAPLKRYNQRAFVRADSGNASWGMQFIWPFKAEYLIAHVNEDYSQAIIARTKRDYVWILARTPELSDSELSALTERVRAMGYDLAKLRRVPQAAATPTT